MNEFYETNNNYLSELGYQDFLSMNTCSIVIKDGLSQWLTDLDVYIKRVSTMKCCN